MEVGMEKTKAETKDTKSAEAGKAEAKEPAKEAAPTATKEAAPAATKEAAPAAAKVAAPAASTASAPVATKEAAAEAPSNLRLILDVPLEISVELGRSKILVKDLLNLGQGSVVELDKLMDEPMEILVNQKRIARGEVVVSNDRFGVRLTDILDPMERLETLQ
jgi:flagellar motor switch protein FliN/FliY